MVTADERCTYHSCSGKNVYRMVGACTNCRAENVLILYTERHDARPATCPLCGNTTVRPQRLATDDEVPVA